MSEQTLGHAAYRPLGLVGNPFRPPVDENSADPAYVGLVTHAAALGLLAALDRAASSTSPSVVWVEKSADLPGDYSLMALAEVLETLVQDESLGILPAYVPLQLMKMGRVRSSLMVVAEHLSGKGFGLTLAAYADAVLARHDASLTEFDALAPYLDEVRTALATDRHAASVRLFGPDVLEREADAAGALEEIERSSALRRRALDTDPEDADDEIADPDTADESHDPADDASEEDALRVAVLDYLTAYAATHLSPVVARAIRAFVARGSYAAGEELKVTKAPRKTLAAVVKLARHRFRRVVVLYDRFDSWELIDPDLRAKIVGALTEMRWASGEGMTMAFLARPGETPEVESQFGSAGERVSWDMRWLARLEQDVTYDAAIVEDWIRSAAIDDAALALLDEPAFRSLPGQADGDVTRYAELAADAVDAAAREAH